ncbi:MAG: alpha/beta fold hydrolase [Gemmatimonadaceae bacterium]|nr:alpha/beta fold hydrolase [Gemmatimonadaceae bacterium]
MPTLIRRLVALLGALLCAIAVFVLASALGIGFWPLALAALAAFLASGWFLLRLAGGSGAEAGRWLVAGGVAYVVVAQLLVGRPPARTLAEVTAPPDTRYWSLGNGTRIAYQLVEPRADSQGATAPRPPVVVLHDGPGTPQLPFLLALGKRPYDFLASEGRAVYYYDQLGSGFSSRLDLAHDAPYTVARHVADLEAIRAQIGAPRLVLAGTGWGATLAVQYLLQHPDHVERLILESPAAIWAPAWPETINPAARARMSDVQASTMAALERPPLRLVLGRMMSDFSAPVAHRWIAEWEGDQWWTQRTEEAMRLGQPNLTCKSDPAESGLPAPAGLGFFANSYTLANALELPDPRPALRKLHMETLIIRGTCDYFNWDVSAEYLQVIKGAHYVAIPAAGHNIWLEQSLMFSEVVGAFLRGEKLPLEAYDPQSVSQAPASR